MEYIKNADQDCRIAQFDEDHEPIGYTLRVQMGAAGVIYQDDGLIHLAIKLTQAHRQALEKLWFVYGNNGPKHTRANHRFVQCFLENGEDRRGMFKPSPELCEAVNAIMEEK